MRILVPLTLAGFALVAGRSLSTDYSRTRTVRTESEAYFSMETTSFEMERDGEPIERPGGFGGSGSEEVRTMVQIDEFLEQDGGRPIHVRRTYETVGAETTVTFGDDSRDSEREGPLSGLVLDLTVDEDGEILVEVEEGETPDDETLLEDLELTFALDAFLPEEEIEEGDSWDLSDEAIVSALGVAIGTKMFPAPEREDAGNEGGRGRRGRGFRGFGGSSIARLIEGATWEGTATVDAIEEDFDGRPCTVIKIEIESSGDIPDPQFGGRGRQFSPGFGPPRPGSADGTFEIELEGRLIFSHEESMPILLELEGDMATERTTEFDRGGGTMVIRRAQEGTFTIKIETSEQ